MDKNFELLDERIEHIHGEGTYTIYVVKTEDTDKAIEYYQVNGREIAVINRFLFFSEIVTEGIVQ